MAKINANRLRWLAESADGKRDVPRLLVERENGDVDVIDVAERKSSDKVLLELETDSRGPGVDGSALIRVSVDGRIFDPSSGQQDRADALFVTQSAIEKFLLPYYMRFKSAAKVQALENMLYNDPTIRAAIHIPPSHPFGVSRTGCICMEPGREEPFLKINEAL